MRVLIKLLIAGLLVHGAFRVGLAYWDFYQFRDDVREAAQFGAGRSPDEVKARVLEIGSALRLSLDPERVTVRREDDRVLVDASYTTPIEALPAYPVPWTFTLHVDAYTLSAVKPGGPGPAAP
jgi:hypothetical protein